MFHTRIVASSELRRLRSDEYERALPPLAELEAIATHKHAPACERSLRLLRFAHEPWDVLRRHVWPRSFRDRIATVMDVTRGRGDEAICFTILSFCGRDWWAGLGPVLGDALVPRPMSGAARCTTAGVGGWTARRCASRRRGAGTRRRARGETVRGNGKAWGGHNKACNKRVRKEAAASAAAKEEAATAAAAEEEAKEEEEEARRRSGARSGMRPRRGQTPRMQSKCSTRRHGLSKRLHNYPHVVFCE